MLVVLALFISGLSAPAHSAIKAGGLCKKAGIERSSNGAGYRCVKSGKKLIWKKISSSQLAPSPSPSPSPTPKPTPTPTTTPTPQEPFKIINSSFSSNRTDTRADDVVTDRLLLETNLKISQILAYFSTREGRVLFTGAPELISGDQLKGRWEIVFKVPSNLAPGTYMRKYLVEKSNGEKIEIGTFPLELVAPRFYIQSNCSDALRNCPQESYSQAILPIDQCKLVDQTIFQGPSNGFPRPADAKIGRFDAKVLIMPIVFRDLPVTSQTLLNLQAEFIEAQEFYTRNSYGKLKLTFTIPEPDQWVLINENWDSWKGRYNGDLTSITRSAISLVKGVNLTLYDSIFFATGKSSSLYWGGGTGLKFPSESGEVTNVYFTVGGNKLSLDHSLGHTLYHLEDLYIHDYFFNTGTYKTRQPLAYDIMAGGGDYGAWNRWLNGWLEDSEVHCVNKSLDQSVFKLNFINNTSGKRLIVIPTGAGKAIFLEYRQGRPFEGKGLWIYRIDSTIGHGAGPMEGDEELLSSRAPEIIKWGYKITLLDASADALYLRITRG